MKILIADPQLRVRHGLRVLLEQQPGWSIVGEAADDRELFALLRKDCPDVILIDWDLPDLSMNTLLWLLREQYPPIQMIIMSGRIELNHVIVKAGCDAFICKADPPEKLLLLIHKLEACSLSPSCEEE